MAIRNVIESDISGKPDAATVTFGLEDAWFEIDLTTEEKKELQKTLERYMSKARKASPKAHKKPIVPETTPEEREKIREWGRENGFNPPAFGRLTNKLQKAYDEAHNIERSK